MVSWIVVCWIVVLVGVGVFVEGVVGQERII